MESRIDRYRRHIVTRCERAGWGARALRGGAETQEERAADESRAASAGCPARFANWIAAFEGKRDQMVERLVARTLASYLEGANAAHDGSAGEAD